MQICASNMTIWRCEINWMEAIILKRFAIQTEKLNQTMTEPEKKKDKEQHKFPMTNFLSLALGQTLECWFSSLSFCGNNQNFQDQAPPPLFLCI